MRNHLLSIALNARRNTKKDFIVVRYSLLLPKTALHVKGYSFPVILKRQSPFRLDSHLLPSRGKYGGSSSSDNPKPVLPCPSFPLSSQNIPNIRHQESSQSLVKILKDNPLFPSLKVPPTASQPV